MVSDPDRVDAWGSGKERPMLTRTREARAEAYRNDMINRIAAAAAEARRRRTRPPQTPPQ